MNTDPEGLNLVGLHIRNIRKKLPTLPQMQVQQKEKKKKIEEIIGQSVFAVLEIKFNEFKSRI